MNKEPKKREFENIIETVSNEISEDALEEVVGGGNQGDSAKEVMLECSYCGRITPHLQYSGGRCICKYCWKKTWR